MEREEGREKERERETEKRKKEGEIVEREEALNRS